MTKRACTRRQHKVWSSDKAIRLPFELNPECGVRLRSQRLTYHDYLHWDSNLNPSPVALWYEKNNSPKLESILTDIKELYYFTHNIGH